MKDGKTDTVTSLLNSRMPISHELLGLIIETHCADRTVASRRGGELDNHMVDILLEQADQATADQLWINHRQPLSDSQLRRMLDVAGPYSAFRHSMVKTINAVKQLFATPDGGLLMELCGLSKDELEGWRNAD